MKSFGFPLGSSFGWLARTRAFSGAGVPPLESVGLSTVGQATAAAKC